MSNRICLVVPYFEDGADLIDTLESVKLESYDHIIVVDDGSIKYPASEVCPSSVHETPVQLLTLPINRGITAALQEGIARTPANTKYIARLDCGDRSAPGRFSAQRTFLDLHPSYVLLGSSVNFVSPTGRPLYTLEQPASPSELRNRMRINCGVTHPAAMFTLNAYHAVGGYSSLYPAAEDYGLFRALLTVGDGGNIQVPLVDCRTGDGGISQSRRRQQLLSRIRVMRDNFDWHPASFYGVMRAVLQLATPRSITTIAHRIKSRVRAWATSCSRSNS